MNNHYAVGKRFSGYYMFLALAFIGGIAVERTGVIPGSRYAPGGPQASFWEAWHLVQQRYVDRDAVQPTRMTEGAIKGMLAFLGDVGHTTYLTREEFEELEKNISGELHGIGARLTLRKGRPTIVQTFPGSPAREAGLLSGDILEKVGDTDVRGLSLQKVVELVRGPVGETVHIRVLRPGHTEPIEFDIRRAKVTIPTVTWHMLPGTSIAHLAILEFGTNADKELRTALQEAQKQNAKGVLLDLRGNPGGLKDQAVAVTSEFLQSGDVFITQDARGRRAPVPVTSEGIATQIPLCVLIDQGTASSAEICAGAIQDYARGKLVGTRTFGTGTVLQPFALSDGSVVMLAVQEWLTPKGRQIWHQGITPDVEVTLPEGAAMVVPAEEGNWTASTLAKSEDRQLLKALEVLQAQIQP